MNILGISAFYHDSAACLVQDGEIIAAAQEERFTRKKHDPNFPQNTIKYCLSEGQITIADIDFVAFYDKPFLKFERILQTHLAYAPFGLRSFLQTVPVWLKKKLWIKDIIKKELNYAGELVFPEHHESHAASAFFPSPFQTAAILTVDGVGEWATTSYGLGLNNKIELHKELFFPHSLGLLYSAFTAYCGFKVNSGEYKLMGLAPYGEPDYVELILSELIDLKDDGSFRLNMKYFNYCTGLTMVNNKFSELFGWPPRTAESKIEQHHMNIARSIQEVTNLVVLKLVQHIHQATGQDNLCLAGGVALNCVTNGKLLRESPFENIWVQPAAGDAGGALGAAMFTWHHYLDNSRTGDNRRDKQKGSLLGPSFSSDSIAAVINKYNLRYTKFDVDELCEKVADLIASQKVIGWFQGRMEFGPRALGNRSIIGDARFSSMQETMNLKIKFRESFRPFAPSVLLEDAEQYFDIQTESPYMLMVAPVSQLACKTIESKDEPLQGFDKLAMARSSVPAVTHVDYSARIQTVNSETNPLYHKLLYAYKKKHNCSLFINTSFNVRGEPIVCTPEEAIQCFINTNMDYLVIEGYIIEKEEKDKELIKNPKWLDQFEKD